MLAQQIPTTTTTATITSTVPSTSQNNDNWLYAGTDEAWLYVDYSQPPYNCNCEDEMTAYKLPQYEVDLDCYDYSTPAKTSEQIWQEVEEFKASASPDDFDEF